MRARRTLAAAAGAVAIFAATALSSCAQSVKITAPRFALVYGVSVYQSMYPEGEYYGDIRTDNLSYSDDDAKSLGDLLANQGWTVQERIKGDIVSGGETSYLPTKAQLISDITALSSLITSDSTVLVYFSGHGDTQNGITYIVPYLGVADSTSPVEDLSKCISPDDLSSMLSSFPRKISSSFLILATPVASSTLAAL